MAHHHTPKGRGQCGLWHRVAVYSFASFRGSARMVTEVEDSLSFGLQFASYLEWDEYM